MRNLLWLGLLGIIILIGACASHHTSDIEQNEQIDLYLSTLNDKHFVWCELDLEQCRKDFEKWKRTSGGRMIIEESEKEAAGQSYTTHHLPNVFRTRFMDERQLTEEMVGDPATVHGTSQNSTVDVGNVTQKIYGSNSPQIYMPLSFEK